MVNLDSPQFTPNRNMGNEKICSNCCWWSANHEKPEKAEGYFPCWNPLIARDMGGNESCEHFMGADATEANVPVHNLNGTMTDPNPNPVDGPTEILIVTYWKDFPWLAYCIKCIQKYCRGFHGVTIAIPHRDVGALDNAMVGVPSDSPVRVVVRAFHEVPGKGMLHHMAMMALADKFVPEGTKYVLLHDADGMFHTPSTPEHFFWENKPYYLIRTWASLGVLDRRHPIAKVASDCAMWKEPTDAQLGWDTEWYTMCVNTQAYPVEFFKPYREYLEQRHRQPFEQYMTSGRNEFPQSIMDHTAMGAWAHRFMYDRFTWFNCENPVVNPYPADRKKAYHSHTGYNWDETKGPIGFIPAIHAELEELVK